MNRRHRASVDLAHVPTTCHRVLPAPSQVVRRHAYKGHLLAHKSSKRKRFLSGEVRVRKNKSFCFSWQRAGLVLFDLAFFYVHVPRTVIWQAVVEKADIQNVKECLPYARIK